MLTTLSKDGIAINTQAKQGRISSKGEDIFLSGQVEMSREANAMQSKLSLKTEFLHIRPSQNLIKTDQAVLLTDANTSVKAVGLEMDYKMRTFKLLSHVRSQYVPVK
jgi:lipopolysaccharide export system protein LptC